MARAALDVVATLVLTVLLLGGYYSIVLASASGFGDAIHHLFLFMDIGIALWVVLLAIVVAGKKPVSVRLTLLFAAIGVVANFVTVTVVGIVQSGGAPEFMRWAAEAGLAFLVAALIAVPLVHRSVSARSRGE